MKVETEKGARLLSLDALRGFDMLFITGLSTVIAHLCAAVGAGNSWLAQQIGRFRFAWWA